MTASRTMRLVLVLAALSVAAIIGMLLVDGGGWDGVLLAVAALPLAAGGWCYRAARRASYVARKRAEIVSSP